MGITFSEGQLQTNCAHSCAEVNVAEILRKPKNKDKERLNRKNDRQRHSDSEKEDMKNSKECPATVLKLKSPSTHQYKNGRTAQLQVDCDDSDVSSDDKSSELVLLSARDRIQKQRQMQREKRKKQITEEVKKHKHSYPDQSPDSDISESDSSDSIQPMLEFNQFGSRSLDLIDDFSNSCEIVSLLSPSLSKKREEGEIVISNKLLSNTTNNNNNNNNNNKHFPNGSKQKMNPRLSVLSNSSKRVRFDLNSSLKLRMFEKRQTMDMFHEITMNNEKVKNKIGWIYKFSDSKKRKNVTGLKQVVIGMRGKWKQKCLFLSKTHLMWAKKEIPEYENIDIMKMSHRRKYFQSGLTLLRIVKVTSYEDDEDDDGDDDGDDGDDNEKNSNRKRWGIGIGRRNRIKKQKLDDDKKQREFQVHTEQMIHRFRCKTVKEKNDWIKTLNKHLELRDKTLIFVQKKVVQMAKQSVLIRQSNINV